MTANSQDFIVIAGDDVAPQFTVVDADGTAIDLRTVLEITWVMQRDLQTAAVLTKKKSTGGISFVNDGSDGKFQVLLAAADTQGLTDFYIHIASIKDSLGNVSTVEIGRVQIGPGPLWTYSGDPSSSNKDAVRFLIGDIVPTDPMAKDPEINFALTQRLTIYGAAALVCRSIAARLSREADTVDKDLRDAISQRAKAYLRMSSQYENQAAMRGSAMPYAGGISIADRRIQIQDTDRVPPQFNIAMQDNYRPVSTVGNEMTDDNQ